MVSAAADWLLHRFSSSTWPPVCMVCRSERHVRSHMQQSHARPIVVHSCDATKNLLRAQLVMPDLELDPGWTRLTALDAGQVSSLREPLTQTLKRGHRLKVCGRTSLCRKRLLCARRTVLDLTAEHGCICIKPCREHVQVS